MRHSPCAAIRGLYGITPDGWDGTTLLEQVEAALQGGLRLLQWRDKTPRLAQAERVALGLALRELTRAHGCCLLINDDWALALAVAADGVHVGEHDAAVATVRAQVPADFLIGASCYNQLGLAQQAEKDGADYVAWGALYPSSTKPQARPTAPAWVREMRPQVRGPVVVIGGITPERLPEVRATGAQAWAVCQALFQPGASAEATRVRTQQWLQAGLEP